MHDAHKPQIRPASDPQPKPEKPAIRLDDLIPTGKVLGGRRVTFGVRTKPFSKSQP